MKSRSLAGWARRRQPGKDEGDGGAFAEAGSFRLPADHKPFLVLADASPSEGFSCLECRAYRHDGERHSCASPDYRRFMGTDELVHPETREPLTGAQVARACSDWFTPK